MTLTPPPASRGPLVPLIPHPSLDAGPSAPTPPALPAEIMDRVLESLDAQDLQTVRAVSQSSRSLEQRLARLQPTPFQQAHVKTLEKALALKTLDVANPRNARLLATMTELRLLHRRQGGVSLPPRVLAALPEAVLAKVAGALPPVQRLMLGAQATNLSLYTGLLGAGLDTSALTTLSLEQCGSVAPQELHHLSRHFQQLPQLTTLRFPQVLAPKGSADAAVGAGLPHYDFAPLTALETFSWCPKTPVCVGGLDFSGNRGLRSLTLCLGPAAPMATLPTSSALHLQLPDAPLVTLRLRPLRLSPQGGNPFAKTGWRASLQHLYLGASIKEDTLDLSGYDALQQVLLAQDGFDLRRLQLPARPALSQLRICGKNAQHLFDQMATLTWDHLTFLQLAMAIEPHQMLSIPWWRMPHISRLSYEYKGRLPPELGRLCVPRQNRITRLDLKGRYLTHPVDPTLKFWSLPRLRELDLGGYRLTRPFVRALANRLEPEPAWPQLARILLHPEHTRSDLKKMLSDLAQQCGVEISLSA